MRRALLLLVAVIGCNEPEALPECRLNSDCPTGETCTAGACVPECREDRDCRASAVCLDGACTELGPQGRLCARASDCRAGETCAAGLCSPIRLDARDAGVRDAGGAIPDAGALLGYGAACMRGSDCESTYCVGDPATGAGRCTIPCGQDLDCVHPDTCEDVPGAGMFCASVASGKPVGAECPGGPAECASNICLNRPSAPSFCSQRCAPLPTCPAGFTCQPLPDGSGGAEPLCVPGQGGGFGAPCMSAAECFTTLCVGVGTTGVCTSLCDRVPCPGGYTCAVVDDGAGGQLQICAPDGAVGGGFGDACTGASGCASGLCVHDARTGSAFCTKGCVSSADCAQIPGLACVRLADGSAICGPP